MSWDFRHFSPDEFDHPERMDRELLARLDYARTQAGIPFVVTSDFRPDENDELDSAHEIGKAVDIRAHDGRTRWRVVKAAINAGIKRIGVYDKHVHLDNATPADDPRFVEEVIWVGVSR